MFVTYLGTNYDLHCGHLLLTCYIKNPALGGLIAEPFRLHRIRCDSKYRWYIPASRLFAPVAFNPHDPLPKDLRGPLRKNVRISIDGLDDITVLSALRYLLVFRAWHCKAFYSCGNKSCELIGIMPRVSKI